MFLLIASICLGAVAYISAAAFFQPFIQKKYEKSCDNSYHGGCEHDFTSALSAVTWPIIGPVMAANAAGRHAAKDRPKNDDDD